MGTRGRDSSRDLSNLYKRLVLLCVASSLSIASFMFVSIDAYVHSDALDRIQADYATCLVTNYQTQFNAEEKLKVIEDGDILEKLENVCTVDPKNKFPSLIALTPIVIVAMTCVSLSALVFSCGRKRMNDWKRFVISLWHWIRCKKRRMPSYGMERT